jgi:hypothetical protein
MSSPEISPAGTRGPGRRLHKLVQRVGIACRVFKPAASPAFCLRGRGSTAALADKGRRLIKACGVQLIDDAHHAPPAPGASNDSNEAQMTRRRRPMFTLLTRPVLIGAHIVVLPTPTSLHAVLTGTGQGLCALRRVT